MLPRCLMPLLLLFMLIASPGLQAADKPNDRAALAGLKTAKVVFDMRVTDSDKLVFNLTLFGETLDSLIAQRIKPEMVVAFRGPGIGLLSATELDEEALDLIRSLKKKGVRFEACALAMRTFKVDPKGLVREIRLVANVFNSLIGYQHKGYALIVIN